MNDTSLTKTANDRLLQDLRGIVGAHHVLTGDTRTKRFRKGFRSGFGAALAVIQPGTLLEQWYVLKACVAADKIVIMQAANTGLTGGSTPDGTYDRDVVLISTKRLSMLHLIKGGAQSIGFPGTTLYTLEKALSPLNRQPHSVIGSSCIGASVIGGICNNSGGSLVERGPAYTEMSIFAQVSETGTLELVNHLGISLGTTPEQILTRLQAGDYTEHDIQDTNAKASDTGYATRVRDVEAATPARFNADKHRLHEASGCAGKLAVFAVRLDTYPNPEAETTFYIGARDPAALTQLRREILTDFETLPVSAEYLHADYYDLIRKYGKDSVVMIDKLGTDWLPRFFALKGAIDARLERVPFLRHATDHFMQALAAVWPTIVPKRMDDIRAQFDHHLILKVRDSGIEEARAALSKLRATRTLDFFECTAREAKIAALYRFAAGAASVRFRTIHAKDVEDILALDIALRRNDEDWFETLPKQITDQIVHALYCGHFLCHVMHQDYIVKAGVDVEALKTQMLEILDKRGAEYPAEHNVGHQYLAKPDLAAFYRKIDPTNTLNPGLGKMSKRKHYAES
ncbi:D-lactate dehydrogenase [Albirhodobacter sp. R86504]|uniref:D-lactate dehydrogenase n=1 Tax=Albirhodobacter sp. R86504 TaxID=3093848 RepID=UPI00366FC135